MKKLILIFVLLCTGCSNIQFDNFVYDSVISIKEVADQGYTECGTDEVIGTIGLLHTNITHLNTYTENRIYAVSEKTALKQLKDIIEVLYQKTSTHQKISVMYCKTKMQNISVGATKIYKTIGQL